MSKMGAWRFFAVCFCAGLLPTAAAAHTGVHYFGDNEIFVSGFLHPLLGLDHLVAMMAVGVWAAYVGGRALLAVPLAFAGMMILGAAFGVNGISLPAAEQAIAVSLVVFGLLICMLAKPPAGVAAAIVGVFAVFHGYAHGTELPDMAHPLAYGAGFVVSTGLLLALGAAIGRAGLRSIPNIVVRGAGAAIVFFGVVTIIGRI